MDSDERHLESENEKENLALDNEILRLKLSAQFGDAFQMGVEKNLPPEIENQFLKNIIEFEENFRNSAGKTVTIYDRIGKPSYTPFEALDKSALAEEIARLTSLLHAKNIKLDFLHGPYLNEVVYRFITEEFFQYQMDDVFMPGMICNFIYEEFHVNNEAEINITAKEFFTDWLNKSFNEFSGEMDSDLVSSTSEQLSREEVYKRIRLFSDCYHEFRNDHLEVCKVQVDEQPDGTAYGFSEGQFTYDGVLESGEIQHFSGPYKLYMRRVNYNWTIFNFLLPGFRL